MTIGGGGAGNCSNVSVPCDDDTDCSVSLCSISGAICNPVDPDACAGTCNDEVTSCDTNDDCPNVGICTNPNNPSNIAGQCTTDADCTGIFECVSSPGVCFSSQGTCEPSTGTCLTGGGGLVCACPGWDTPGTGDDWIDYGSNCCPPGTIQNVPGQCSLADNAGVVVQAVPVEVFNNIEFTYPFRVNLPPDSSQFFLIAPSGTEGVPGTVTNVPYDPSQPIDFTVPPAGEEGGPP